MKKGNKSKYITEEFFLHNLSEFTKDIVAGITTLTNEQGKRLDRIESKLDSLGTNQNHIKQDIQDLKWDTVSRSAFNQLKQKVHGHHPSN